MADIVLNEHGFPYSDDQAGNISGDRGIGDQTVGNQIDDVVRKLMAATRTGFDNLAANDRTLAAQFANPGVVGRIDCISTGAITRGQAVAAASPLYDATGKIRVKRSDNANDIIIGMAEASVLGGNDLSVVLYGYVQGVNLPAPASGSASTRYTAGQILGIRPVAGGNPVWQFDDYAEANYNEAWLLTNTILCGTILIDNGTDYDIFLTGFQPKPKTSYMRSGSGRVNTITLTDSVPTSGVAGVSGDVRIVYEASS